MHRQFDSDKPVRGRVEPALLWGLTAAWIGWASCAAALWLIVFVHVESVLVTGSVIAVSGLIAAYLGRRAKYVPLQLLGFANFGVCLLFFALVYLLSWNPDEAKDPFTVMGAMYVLTTFPCVLMATINAPRVVDPWVCATCGYLLYGLTEPRCPECGAPFDPSLLDPGHAMYPPPSEARGVHSPCGASAQALSCESGQHRGKSRQDATGE